jgi:hypothetical protein
MEPTQQPSPWERLAPRWMQQAAKWLERHGGYVQRKVLQWLGFWAGLVLGTALALLVYAVLQPRIAAQVQVNREKARLATGKAKLDSLAMVANAAVKPVIHKHKDSSGGGSTSPPDTIKRFTSPSRLTQLASRNPAGTSAARPLGPALLAALAMLAALAATVVAWQQKRRKPQPAGTISSPVLEALFTLQAHLDFLQKRLKLSPRQIKRFSSKARIQHVQLRAAAQLAAKAFGELAPEIFFPVAHQIKAFQLLLLLEETHNAPSFLSANDADEFSRQLQCAYSADKDLRTAWDEALANPEVITAQIKEGPVNTAAFDSHPGMLLRQMYELNAGLLT